MAKYIGTKNCMCGMFDICLYHDMLWKRNRRVRLIWRLPRLIPVAWHNAKFGLIRFYRWIFWTVT